jgi:pilus assembly protein CpaE
MSPKIPRTLLAVHGAVDVAALEKLIIEEPGLQLAGLIDNDAAWSTRTTIEADILVVACAGPSDAVLDLVSEEAAVRPAMPVVVLCEGAPTGFVRQAFEAGADDVVLAADLKAAGPHLYFAIEKASARKSALPADNGDGVGQLICVLGPKGGTGKTLTASNLAVGLAREDKRVVLVDLDLQFGDLGLVMGLAPERTIFDLVTSGGTLDAQKVEAFLAPHKSGVQLLMAPTRPDHAAAVTPDFLRDLYPILRQQYDYVVVDTPPGFTPEVIATIDAASSVCLIGTLDAPSLKNAKLGAETLELMGYPSDHIRVILNRADTSVGVSHADVVSVLGRAPDVLVPSNREVVRSVNAGAPIVAASPKSEAAKAFQALAHMYVMRESETIPTIAPKRRPMGMRALGRS